MNREQLRRAFKALPPLDASADYWTEKRREIQVAILEHEPAGFLHWAAIRATMFVGAAPQYEQELPYLTQRGYKWVGYMTEFGGVENTNLMHQAYHLARWEEQTDKQVRQLNHVVEIGGGYGAMARIFQAAGFQGSYTIFDCPEFSLLQQYYLSQMDVPVRTEHSFPRKRIPCDLLVACCSLSEMSRVDQSGYVTRIDPKGLLVQAKDASWFGEDNTDLFRMWEHLGAQRVPAVYPPESYYLFQ